MKHLKFLLLSIFPIVIWEVQAESPRVPQYIDFAGMKLKLTSDAQKEIQHEVDQLTSSPKYYEIKADRVKLYFPAIIKTLKEQGVPEEFKYLALQESALISDAVSSANAVGFWQFKDFTGREVGLRIDKSIDERLNIIASTVGAAKYFKRHNFYFNNWIYTLLAHMTGRGGAAKYVDESNFGSNKMTIDRHTHWYVKRFLSHMIAFEGAESGIHTEGLSLEVFTGGGGMSLNEIAHKKNVDLEELKMYNKWLKSGKVPTDKEYSVMLPRHGKVRKTEPSGKETKPETKDSDETVKEMLVKTFPDFGGGHIAKGIKLIYINDILCVLGSKGDKIEALSAKVGLSAARLAKYNDMELTDPIEEGQIYYLKSKRSRAKVYYYTVLPGESLWEISQKMGIKLKNLIKLNRMEDNEKPIAGRVLWLKRHRPEETPVEIQPLPQMPVDETMPVKKGTNKVIVPVETVSEIVVAQDTTLSSDKPVSVYVEPEEEEIEIEEPVIIPDGEAYKYIVKKGESIYSISLLLEVTISNLSDWNELPDYNLSIGQVLIYYSTTGPKPKQVAIDTVVVKTAEPVVTKNSNDLKKAHEYEVKKGETLYMISRQLGVTVPDLVEWNQLKDYNLSVGQVLIYYTSDGLKTIDEKVVSIESKDNQRKEYVVKKGETVYMISRQLGVTVPDLVEWNQLKDYNLSVGQILFYEGENGIQTAEIKADSAKEVQIKLAEPDAAPILVHSYVVKKGETLYMISKELGVTVSDLMEWNELKDFNLQLGQKLVYHGTKASNTKEVPVGKVDFHVVEPGDTMYSIAVKYNISVNDLLKYNQRENFQLSVGEKLRVSE